MKQTSRKKLALDSTTVRPMLEGDLLGVHGGLPRISVGTCTACNPTYNPTCRFSCIGNCA